MSFTFATLKTAIQDYTQNTETTFVNNLSRFIINTEERILKECQLEVFRKNVTGSLTSSNKFLTKPSDYLSSFSLSIVVSSENKFLLYKHTPTWFKNHNVFLETYKPLLDNPEYWLTGDMFFNFRDWSKTKAQAIFNHELEEKFSNFLKGCGYENISESITEPRIEEDSDHLGDLDDELEDIDEVDNIRAFKKKTMYNDYFDKPSDTE